MKLKDTMLAALIAAALTVRLTGRLNAVVVLLLLAALIWMIVSTRGDGARALRYGREAVDDD